MRAWLILFVIRKPVLNFPRFSFSYFFCHLLSARRRQSSEKRRRQTKSFISVDSDCFTYRFPPNYFCVRAKSGFISKLFSSFFCFTFRFQNARTKCVEGEVCRARRRF